MSTPYPIDLQRHVERLWAMRMSSAGADRVAVTSLRLPPKAADVSLREIEPAELPAALDQHRAWLNNGKERFGQRADLCNTHLAGLSFWSADLREAELRGADLRGCNLDHAQLSRAVMSGACLSNASCWSANMTEVILSKADLTGTNLDHADLRGADLRDADLTNASLWGAHLEGADLRGAVGIAQLD
jgi:uncharacterized protein YjbI with pentapeptide repeats